MPLLSISSASSKISILIALVLKFLLFIMSTIQQNKSKNNYESGILISKIQPNTLHFTARILQGTKKHGTM